MIQQSFEIVLAFPNFLRYGVVWQHVRQLRYTSLLLINFQRKIRSTIKKSENIMNMNVDIYYYLSTKNMMSFTIGLDTLYIKKKNGIEYVTSHNYGEIEVHMILCL